MIKKKGQKKLKKKLPKKILKEEIIDPSEGKINPGKSYASYLKEYNKKNRKVQSKLMREAKKTIRDLNKNRDYKIMDFDFENDWSY